MVPKKNKEIRQCGDYRALIKQTVVGRYPVPHTHDIIIDVEAATILSKIDLVKAYYHVLVTPNVPKTAVITQSGLLEFSRISFN